MQYYYTKASQTYETIVLLRDNEFHEADSIALEMAEAGTDLDTCLFLGLPIHGKLDGKGSRAIIGSAASVILTVQARTIVSGSAPIIKALSKQNVKVGKLSGKRLPVRVLEEDGKTKVFGEADLEAVYCPTKGQCFASPLLEGYKTVGLKVIAGKDAVDHSYSTKMLSIDELEDYLTKQLDEPLLAVDIETPALALGDVCSHPESLQSIGFASSASEGVAITVDRQDTSNKLRIRQLLIDFFSTYKGRCIFHGSNFDVPVLVQELFAEHPLDVAGIKHGVEVFESAHDTKVIAYHATNSATGNKLDLKHLASPLLGDWAVDVTDTTQLSDEELCKYNAEDAIATYWVFHEYFPKLVEDDQVSVYETVSQPSLAVFWEAKCMGLPTNPRSVKEARRVLNTLTVKARNAITSHAATRAVELNAQRQRHETRLKELVKKFPRWEDSYEPFNPGSGKQVSQLLYTELNLPIIETTASGQPATDKNTLKKLLDFLTTQERVTSQLTMKYTTSDARSILDNLLNYTNSAKLLSTFIPAMERGWLREDGMRYLNGSLNVGGTVSGRLSSSDP